MQRNRPRVFLPPATLLIDAPDEVKRAAERLTDVLTEQQRLLSDLTETRKQLIDAREQDKRALADAIRDGDLEPSRHGAEEYEEVTRTIETRLAAVELAVIDLENALGDQIEEHREAWQETIRTRLDAVRATYGEAVENLATAARRLDEINAVARFVQAFPSAKAFSVTSSPIPVRGLSGDHLRVEAVLDGLRKLADAPPARDPEPEHAAPGGKMWPTSGVSRY